MQSACAVAASGSRYSAPTLTMKIDATARWRYFRATMANG